MDTQDRGVCVVQMESTGLSYSYPTTVGQDRHLGWRCVWYRWTCKRLNIHMRLQHAVAQRRIPTQNTFSCPPTMNTLSHQSYASYMQEHEDLHYTKDPIAMLVLCQPIYVGHSCLGQYEIRIDFVLYEILLCQPYVGEELYYTKESQGESYNSPCRTLLCRTVGHEDGQQHSFQLSRIIHDSHGNRSRAHQSVTHGINLRPIVATEFH